MLLQCCWLDVELLGNLGNSDEGERHGHGLTVARHRGQGGVVSSRQRLGFYPPQLCRLSDGGGRGGDQRSGHHRDRGHHGVTSGHW